MMIVFGIFLAAVMVLIALDAGKKINLLHPVPLTLYLPLAANPILLGNWFYRYNPAGISPAARTACMVAAGVFIFYLWLRLNIAPRRDRHKPALRVRIMMNGRYLCFAGLWAIVLGIGSRVASFLWLRGGAESGLIPDSVFIINAIYGGIAALFILANGILRIFFTSRRLSIVWRLLMLFTLWIPVVNLAVLLYVCRLVYEEYDFALYKENLHLTRVDSELCKTKYPLVMVHGVLFRDLKFFNYWGRIPRELIRNGATIYYGNQEAVGTVAANAEDIRKKIFAVLKETGAEKVNIIAHSKGGLDSRYAITLPGVEDKVASLTTICTPHRGCRFVDKACNLPEWFYRFIAKIVDNSFRKMGDKNPDFYTATRQFSTLDSENFNRRVPDSPKVYYQSYMSRMKGMRSDPMLGPVWRMIKSLEGDNDGLVSVNSAVWGEFRGVIESESRKGISHGDIIDLKRADYRGFDVVEKYVRIVSDLKEKGF